MTVLEYDPFCVSHVVVVVEVVVVDVDVVGL